MQPKVIRIDGVIGTGQGEVSAQMVREQLPINGTDPIAVKIHSEGGSVFEGFAIHDLFANYQGPKSLSIESTAFSIASFVAMAFDDVEISSNGYMMLHNPYVMAEGDDDDLAKQVDMLRSLKSSMINAYVKRTGKTEDEIKAILKAETYLNAQQSVEMGLASRIASQPVIGRKFAKIKSMPHGVVTALFGAGSGGDTRDSRKDSTMPESQSVAATLTEIKAAFPKASSDFIVRCLERSLPMASVASAAVEEMMAENEQLKAKVAAMEEELAKVKGSSKAEGDIVIEEEDEDEMAMEDEEEQAKAKVKAKAKGVAPIAKSKASAPSAKSRWEAAIEACLPKCNGDRRKAVAMANKANPNLRQAMLDEVNS